MSDYIYANDFSESEKNALRDALADITVVLNDLFAGFEEDLTRDEFLETLDGGFKDAAEEGVGQPYREVIQIAWEQIGRLLMGIMVGTTVDPDGTRAFIQARRPHLDVNPEFTEQSMDKLTEVLDKATALINEINEDAEENPEPEIEQEQPDFDAFLRSLATLGDK